LGVLIVSIQFMTLFGVTLEDGGMLMARVLGSALTAFTLIFRWNVNTQNSETLWTILRASFIYNIVDLPVVLMATLTGVMDMLGWSVVLLHLLLAAGFGYFGNLKR
jgi:hypothetical protein